MSGVTLAQARDVLGLHHEISFDDAVDAMVRETFLLAPQLVACGSAGDRASLQRWRDLADALDTITGSPTIPLKRPDPEAESQTQRTPDRRGDNPPTDPDGPRGDGEARAASSFEVTNASAHERVPWPEVPSYDNLQPKLRKAARWRRMLRRSVFDELLDLIDGSAIRCVVRRIVEQRSEKRVSVAGPASGGRTYSTSIDLLRVGTPTKFKDQKIEFRRAGSEETEQCAQCSGAGGQRCSMCGGAGRVACPPMKTCGRCSGRGIDISGQRCTGCAGRGLVICGMCGGSGQHLCIWCRGRGNNQCKACKGHGFHTSFVVGTVEHKVVTSRVEPDLAEIGNKRSIKPSDWAVSLAFSGESAPAGLPPAVAERIQTDLVKRPTSERKRQLEIQRLPIAWVRDDMTETPLACVLGVNQRVWLAPRRRLRRHSAVDQRVLRIALAVTIGIVLIGALVVAALLVVI